MKTASSSYLQRGSWAGATLLVAALVLAVTGCHQKMDISDQELIERIEECLAPGDKSPGMAVACGNYQRECERRGKATGNYFC